MALGSTAGAHDPHRRVHRLLGPDAFQHRLRTEAFGQIAHAGDTVTLAAATVALLALFWLVREPLRPATAA